MGMIRSVILGFIQGLTEFLPVSSSGHLILGASLFGLDAPGLSSSIVLHLGTALATIVMLRSEILWFIKGIFGPRGVQRTRAFQMAGYIVLASVPAALAGILGGDLVDRMFSSEKVAAAGLIITGFLLGLTRPERDRVSLSGPPDESNEFSGKDSPEPDIPSYRPGSGRGGTRLVRPGQGLETDLGLPSVSAKTALLVGLGQAVAVIPGISRSGTTMATGILAGVAREDAARFSFLLSLPAVFGAALLDLRKAVSAGLPLLSPEDLAGGTAAFIAGIFALATVFRLVKRGELSKFSYYCWFAGIGFLIYSLVFS